MPVDIGHKTCEINQVFTCCWHGKFIHPSGETFDYMMIFNGETNYIKPINWGNNNWNSPIVGSIVTISMVSTGNKQVDGLILDKIRINRNLVMDHLPDGICMMYVACGEQCPTKHCCEEEFWVGLKCHIPAKAFQMLQYAAQMTGSVICKQIEAREDGCNKPLLQECR